MRALTALLTFVITTNALGSAAFANIIGRNRYHLLDSSGKVRGIRARLSKEAQRNVSAIGLFSDGGTGSLVAIDKNGEGLVLTALHLVPPANETWTIRFSKGTKSISAELQGMVVAGSGSNLDYALVAVNFNGRNAAEIPVAHLKQSGFDMKHRVYRSGFDALWADFHEGVFDRSGRDRAFAATFSNSEDWSKQIITSGRPLFKVRGSEELDGYRAPVLVDMAAAGGGSGSPLFDAVNHRVVGILVTGPTPEKSITREQIDQSSLKKTLASNAYNLAMSVADIVADLKKQLRAGEVSPRYRQQVISLLGE